MLSDSIKLTNGMIIFSALVSDFEQLDFKNDALAGVRANYFNSGNAEQKDKTDVVFNNKMHNLSYDMSQGKPLLWKIIQDNQPVQKVKKATGGVYCVIFYGENGIINKREYFDKEHIWLRTEYYSSIYENLLSAVIYPKNVSDVTVLCFERILDNGKRIVKTLFPSDKMPQKRCFALVYSNCGMLWYDESFAPEDMPAENQSEQGKHGKGFSFCLEPVAENERVDLLGADYLNTDEIVVSKEENKAPAEELPEEEQPYSAYDKIEKILTEAHKTNKDLFGEIINQTAEAPEAEIEAPAEDKTSEAEEPVCELTQAESVQEEDATEQTESAEQSEFSENAELEETAFNKEELPPCNVVIHTKSGKYTYYGAVDENNCRTGRGRTVTPDGLTSYDGEYLNDKRNGFGVCYYKEGVINYVGEWTDGNREGSGVGYRLSDGTMHAGRWKNNMPDGIGARFSKDGELEDVCRYENGVRNGKSVSFDKDGNVIIETWKDGELVSRFVAGED